MKNGRARGRTQGKKNREWKRLGVEVVERVPVPAHQECQHVMGSGQAVIDFDFLTKQDCCGNKVLGPESDHCTMTDDTFTFIAPQDVEIC